MGMVKLGRPPGPGPVFEFEWITATRRWQGYALRSVFVLLLLSALVACWFSRSAANVTKTIRASAEIGSLFYTAVIGTQLTLVLLAAPAATAGAICIDRARGALTHLLVTDLSDSEIVLGKLAARLVPVLGLIVCALPVMALLTLLGGVDPDALAGAFAVSVGVGVLGCALALVFSLWAGKTHEALLGTYAVWCFWLLGGLMLKTLNAAFNLSIIALPREADPFHLAFAPYWYPGQVGWTDYLAFLGGTLAISAALTGVAIWRLRPVCTRVNVRKARPGLRLSRFVPTSARLCGRVARPFRSFGPSLDGNPVLWREWHRNRPSGWTRTVWGLYFTLAATFSAIAVVWHSGMMMVVVNAFQVAIGLLLLSVSAATSLAEERVRGSLDVLMATPLSTRQIVVGKWLGAFRRVPWLALLPTLVVLFTGRQEVVNCVIAAVAMLGYVVCCGAAVTSLGLATATWCSRLGRAVGLTITAYVLMTVGWMFLVMALFNPTPFGWSMITGSPFYGSLFITAHAGEPRFANSDASLVCAFFWMFVYGGLAIVLLAATLATFNRFLGRVEEGFASLALARPTPVVMVRVKEGVREPFEVA